MKKTILLFILAIPMLSFSQKRKAVDGYYYDLHDNKHEGVFFLKSKFQDESYRELVEYRDGKKVKKQSLSPDDIKSFVLATDSFAVIKNIKLTGLSLISSDFAKVLSTGKINLFQYRVVLESPTSGIAIPVNYLVYNKNGTSVYTVMQRPMKHKTRIATLASDNREIASKLRNLKAKDIREQLPLLVEEYNKWLEEKDK